MGTAKFTQDGLSRLLGTTGQRLVIHDPKTPGLRAELREGGTLAFYVFRRPPGGGPIRMRLGDFPTLTVDAARTAALGVLVQIASGINPAIGKRAKQGEPTLKELFEHWLELHGKPHKK